MPEKRQLAAILFTDIVGYTALMGKDASKAMELVRQSIIIQKPLVEKNNGKWCKEMGDGAMAQFQSALDAVNCAMEIQRMAKSDFDAKIRIGIHLGDITFENNDIYGDGVNVASRLESIADPGGIYISDAIEKAIRGQSDIQAKYLGELKLKNVTYEVRTYAIQGTGFPVPQVTDKKSLSGHLWAEIQRRGIIRAALAYLVFSMLLFLLIPNLASYISLPGWITKLSLAVVSIAFLPAMYLAWTFERSPEGFVKTNSKQSWQNPYKASQRKPFTSNTIITGLLLVILAMYFYPTKTNKSNQNSISAAEETIDDKSIAVLPFADMSPQGDQEWFSDGMMEEILNHLVRIQDLLVISRTSAMRFKGSEKSLQEIGRELGVSHVLEGSVRKQGNKVRITVQLIDVKTDRHLWSETYDKDLIDVFIIQSEVAQQVAASLQAEVQPEIKLRIESQPTYSTEAYDLYLEAQSVNLNDEINVQKSIKLLEESIKLDPEFADAYLALGDLKSWFGFAGNSLMAGPQEAYSTALPYYQKALELDPYNYMAHQYLADIFLWYKWDFKSAEKEYRTSLKLNPNNPGSIDYLIAMGHFQEAAEIANKAVKADPLNGNALRHKVLSLYFNHQTSKAFETIEKSPPETKLGVYMEAQRVYTYLGMYDKAIETGEILLEWDRRPRFLANQAISYFNMGDKSTCQTLIDEMKELKKSSTLGSPSFYLSMVYAQIGEVNTAFEWLENSFQNREVEMYWLKVEPPFEPLHSDPRWQEMLDKVGFPE